MIYKEKKGEPPFSPSGQAAHSPSSPIYGNIPHYDIEGAYQTITYRLGDSLPVEVLKEFGETGGTGGSPVDSPHYIKTPEEKKSEDQRRHKIEKYLDAGHGACVLQRPEIAKIVIDNWHFFDSQRYDLIAYVVMPNHVHVLIKTYKEWMLRDVVHGWKSFTGKEIKKELLKTGEPPVPPAISPAVPPSLAQSVWQSNYWDRFIRNEQHFYNTVQYIHNNPVKAGLCKEPKDWYGSSVATFIHPLELS